MENSSLEKIYRTHHEIRRKPFFTLEKDRRGKFLREKIGKGKNILDVGCRDGALTSTYYEGNEVLGVDIDGVALKRAEETFHIKTKKLDLNGEWDLPNDYFDVVVIAEVLEHLYYPDVVMQKIFKCLKPGGIIVGSIPHAFSLQNRVRYFFGTKKSTPLQDPTHINHFFYRDLRNGLEKYFSNVKIEGITSNKYKLISWMFPYFLANTFLFYGRK